ncbi:MAG TPA: SIMPL domain-containing protein [Roseiarcus sp.]|nr:SIMPL domain-containing protein [Roseiarcus sp.]
MRDRVFDVPLSGSEDDKEKVMRYLPLLCIAASVLAPVAAPPAHAYERELIDVGAERWVEVSGEGSVNVAPDFARVTLGVTTTGKDAREAVAANAKAVNSLISMLKGEGVAAADIQTSSLSITPEFSNPRSNSPTEHSITGYNVSDMVTVTVRDIPHLGSLIDKAVEAGANAMYGIAYGENDPSALLDKARPLAVADAKRKAEIYASAGDARVGRLMELTEQTGAQPLPFARRAYVQSAAAAPTPIEAGEDRLTVSVTALFELLPK